MARASAIACGYEDAIDLDRLRHHPFAESRGWPLSASWGAAGVAIDHLSPGECAEQDRGGAKNTLTATDANTVAGGFQARLIALDWDQLDSTPAADDQGRPDLTGEFETPGISGNSSGARKAH